MNAKNKHIRLLLVKYKEILLLNSINALLGWDMSVNLPANAAEGRAGQIAYITKLLTEKWLDPEFKKFLESSIKEINKLNSFELAVLRNLEQSGKYYFKIPKELIVEIAETQSRSFIAWQKAKENNDFKFFEPHLVKMVKLNQLAAKHLGYKDNPYDALLDLYEPGLTTKKVKEIFSVLQPELTKILKQIKKSKTYNESADYIGGDKNYSVNDQRQLSLFVLRRMNYDLTAGRMDISSHPFTETIDQKDVRITNRYKTNDFVESLMVSLHEGGHALYEQGVDEKYRETPLEGGASLGIHESQSRFWENQIGRSMEFIKFIEPILHAFYPEQLSQAGAPTLYKLVNKVRPSLIRTEADEVTYNLHIALRFELEEGLVTGNVKVEDLPEVWRKKMKDYLGIVPETDREGVLQDVHWSHDLMGYFPTYTLGNLYATQFTDSMRKSLDIEQLTEKGELGTILSWLRENIHSHGSFYTPEDLVEKVTGESLNSKYFLDYIKEKYSAIYNL